MERRAQNPLLMLLVLIVLSCLIVYPPTLPLPHLPMSRSLRLGNQQQHLTALKLTSQEMAIINLGKPAARMDFEVNDYPDPDHNHHHGPGHLYK